MAKIQSILVPKYKKGKKVSVKKANKWITDNNYKVAFGNKKGPHETENYYRYRQALPKKNAKYFTKEGKDGVRYIIS